MYYPQHTSFDPRRPLLSGWSYITIGQALVYDQFAIEAAPEQSGEVAGAALLATTKLHHVKDEHLQARHVRFAQHPGSLEEKRERLAWMWHAGSRSSDLSSRARAEEAIDVMMGQVAPECDFDLDDLAEALHELENHHPAIIAALFAGDLDDIPDQIERVSAFPADQRRLVELAAQTYVCWAALEQQRTASLGWRQMRSRLTPGPVEDQVSTIGQLFGSAASQHELAHRMMRLHTTGEALTDKRSINSIERNARQLGFGWLNRANEAQIVQLFGTRRNTLAAELQRASATADRCHAAFQALQQTPDGSSRAGQRSDMLRAPISAVHQTHIVCARTYHLATLARVAESTDDLRSMLCAQMPAVLMPSHPGVMDSAKLRLLQLFHVVRSEFLRDPEHRAKAAKGKSATQDVKLELDEKGRRRGHELTDQCRVALQGQPTDWRFSTPFGWQCDRTARHALSATNASPGSDDKRDRSSTMLHDDFQSIFQRQCAASTGCTLTLLHLASGSSTRPRAEPGGEMRFEGEVLRPS